MGDPRKQKRQYPRPSHPWQKVRIDEEKELLREYGIKNKKELWKSTSLLNSATNQAKTLIPLRTEQSKKEEQALLQKLVRLGLLPNDAKVEDILNLNKKSILDRRLQTLLFRKGLARSVNQARQFIIHEHVIVSGKKISSPSYLVNAFEEDSIAYSLTSSFSDENHPELNLEMQKKFAEKVEAEKTEETKEAIETEPVETTKEVENKKDKTEEKKTESSKEKPKEKSKKEEAVEKVEEVKEN